MLSSQHHTLTIMEEQANKPEIILSYNSTKGGVDTLDHLVSNFTCRRKTNRWTTNMFFFMLDIAAYNTFVFHSMKSEQIKNARLRRTSLERLSTDLMERAIHRRMEDWRSNRACGVHSNIVDIAIRKGYYNRNMRSSSSTVGNCNLCNRAKKSRNTCHFCKKIACKEHSLDRTVVCTNCDFYLWIWNANSIVYLCYSCIDS